MYPLRKESRHATSAGCHCFVRSSAGAGRRRGGFPGRGQEGEQGEEGPTQRLAGRGPGGQEAGRGRRRTARGRRTQEGRRGLAERDREISSQPTALRGSHAAGQLLPRARQGLRQGTSPFRGDRGRGQSGRGPAGRVDSEDRRLLLPGPQLRQVLRRDAGRDRALPGQQAGQPGLLLHRAGPLPTRPLQPCDRGPGKGRHQHVRRRRPGVEGRGGEKVLRPHR